MTGEQHGHNHSDGHGDHAHGSGGHDGQRESTGGGRSGPGVIDHGDHVHEVSEAPLRYGILTCSDRGAAGERADVTGPTIHNIVVDRMGGTVAQYRVVPDNREAIAKTLTEWVDEYKLDIILTNGGTGLSPTDITPEATRDVIEKEVPAIIQAILVDSLRVTPYAMLTRATAGIRGQTLILNLPGSPKAATENLDAVTEILPHAIPIIRGEDPHAVRERAKAQAAARAAAGTSGSAGRHEHGGHEGHEEKESIKAAAQPAGGIARNVGGPTC